MPAAGIDEPNVHQALGRHITSAFLLILGGQYLHFAPEERGTMKKVAMVTRWWGWGLARWQRG